MRLIIPGQKPTGPSEDDFRKLSVAFSNYIRDSLFIPESANPFWPLDRNANGILGGLWGRMIQLLPIAGISAYQPDQLSVEVMRHRDHLVAVMRFPRLKGCLCISAAVWMVGPLEDPSPESLAKGTRQMIILGEDVGTPGEAAIYDLSDGTAKSIGTLLSAELDLFVTTVLGRFIDGSVSVCYPKGDESIAQAMADARGLLSYFIDVLETYPAVNEYSVKVRYEDENGGEYFWLEETKWENGKFSGRISNDPQVVRCVKCEQPVEVLPEQVCDWYYMWEGKMRGNYTLRASLPLLDPEHAAKLSAIFEM